MKRSLQILIFFLFLSCCFVACGIDEPTSEDSSLTINNNNIGKMLNTLCEITEYPSYLGGGKELSMEADFTYNDDGIMIFNMSVPSIRSLSQLKMGMDLSDYITIYTFRPMHVALIDARYNVLSGSATVENISNTALVLKFSNFKILREFGNKEETFTLNGTISYAIKD